MKKSLIALAALAAVGVASAQSNVTLSGNFKAGVASTKYSNGAAGNGSGLSVADGSSRFIISGAEDLGGGLKGVFQLDQRFRVDDRGATGTTPIADGNTFVGLTGGFGTIRLGKLDTHYCLGADSHGARATALQASSCGVLGFVSNAAIANASRSSNVINYVSPRMGGLTAGVSYSTNYTVPGNEGLGDAGDGRAFNARADYAGGPLTLGVSYWNARSENRTPGAARADQKAWTLAGGYNFGFATVGLTFDRSAIEGGVVGGAAAEAERDAWSIPVTVPLGAGTFLFTYTKARDVDGTTNTGATLWSLGYDYALSKRTSLGVSYANLKNDAGAAYNLYTEAALGAHPATVAGQDARQLYVGIRHAF